jgi:hypothetical protein
MARYRANWREPIPPLKGTLPNGWVYQCLDFDAGTKDEADVTARRLVSPVGEFLTLLHLDVAPTSEGVEARQERLPRFTERPGMHILPVDERAPKVPDPEVPAPTSGPDPLHKDVR